MSEKPTRGQRKPTRGRPLESIRSQVAGIDLGSQEHWVCGPPRGDGKPNVRTYVEWLRGSGQVRVR